MQDPRLALKLVDELDLENRREGRRDHRRTAQSSTQRSELLDELRNKAAEDPDRPGTARRRTGIFGESMAGEGFEASQAWLEQNPLSPAETFGLSKA